MTIRLRLTLVYSAILTLTLIVFGVLLYTIQSRDTLKSLEQDLVMSSNKFVDALLTTNLVFSNIPPQHNPPPPRTFSQFTEDQTFQDFREREIVRILDPYSNLLASAFGQVEDALPLSDDALSALQGYEDVFETGIISDENMLIYSRPIIYNGNLVYIVQVARSLTERDRTLQSLATILTIAGLATILVAFGVGWGLSGLALRPIDRITQTAKAIGEERDFKRRVEHTGKQDEVGQLANTFNQMLARLQDAYQKVELSLTQQRNFVSDVSHELRTPLTTLRGNLGLLLHRPPVPPEEQEDILTDMVHEGDRMIRLVNELLLMAHADAKRSLAKEVIPLHPFIEEITRQAYQLAPNRRILTDISPDLMLIGDRDALKQVILNLLENALKYSKGDVHVRAQRVNHQVEISVQDQGEGIPPEQVAHVFDRFYRAEENLSESGFGLGLPIAKSLVEGMGGCIRVESQIGKGSLITATFPGIENTPAD